MKYRWGLIFVLFFIGLAIWLAIWWQSPSDYLSVAFLDVGQGDAILITAPNKNQVLIDGGKDQAVVRALSQVMPFYDRSIDLVVASHPDQDHIGGLPDVFERYEVSGIIESNFIAETAVYQKLQRKIMEEKASHIKARVGTKIILGPKTYLEIISAEPPLWGPRGGKPDSNYSSIVAKLTHASTTFLFTGDASLKLVNKLISQKRNELEADVLKVSHHGAKSSNSREFFKIVDPAYAIISVGQDNRYNHPSPETLSWLNILKPEILQTKDLGTIVLKSDGLSIGL